MKFILAEERCFKWIRIQLTILFYARFPINIQFATFLFLVLFFVAVIHKKTWEESWKKKATFLFIFVNITLLALFLGTYLYILDYTGHIIFDIQLNCEHYSNFGSRVRSAFRVLAILFSSDQIISYYIFT